MNRTAIVIAIIVCGTGLSGWYLYLETHRYHLVGGGADAAYEVDRKTGKTWIIRSDEKAPHVPQGDTGGWRELAVLPPAEIAAVTGTCGRGGPTVSLDLYNGSSWDIQNILLIISAKRDEQLLSETADSWARLGDSKSILDLKERLRGWKRQYRVSVLLEARTKSSFSFEVLEGSRYFDYTYVIVEARGRLSGYY